MNARLSRGISIIGLAALAGCAGQQAQPEAPPVGATAYPYYSTSPNGVYWDHNVPFRATVGLPFQAFLYAGCRPSGQWSMPLPAQMATGRLPPGLQFGQNDSIVGVPTQAGSFSFTVQLHSMVCDGRSVDLSTWLPSYTIVVTGN